MKDCNRKLTDQLQKLAEEYDTYKVCGRLFVDLVGHIYVLLGFM